MNIIVTNNDDYLHKILTDDCGYNVEIVNLDLFTIDNLAQNSPQVIIILLHLENIPQAIQVSRICNAILPVIFISETYIESFSAYLDEIIESTYLVKPVSSDNLRAAIQMAIRRFDHLKIIRQSEDTFRIMVENSKELIAVIDTNGNFTYNNQAHLPLTGFSPEELLYKNAFGFVHPDDLSKVMETYKQIHEQDLMATVEFRFRKKDNSWFWVEASGTINMKSESIVSMVGFSRDITERKLMELKIIEKEKFYREIVENLPVLICRFKTGSGIITYVNSEYCRYFNIEHSAIVGKSFFDLVPAEEHPYIKKKFESLNKDNPYIAYEHSVFVNNEIKYQRWIDQALFDESCTVIEYQSIGIDLTEKKIAEEALKVSEKKYRQLFENENDAVMIYDAETLTFEDANKAALKLFDYTKDVFLTLSLFDIASEMTKSQHSIENSISNNSNQPIRYFKKSNGSIFPGELSSGSFESKNRTKIIATIRDISERIKMEKEIARIARKERVRIGQDLHDGLGQYLTGISLALGSLKMKIMNNKSIRVKEIEEINNYVNETKENVNNILQGLIPITYDTGNIFAALDNLVKQVEKRFPIACSIKKDGAIDIYDEIISVNLFYIAQEAINNSIKHSNTKKIDIDLSYKNSIFSLKIQDYGNTFDNQNKTGLGLKIMQHRAHAIGADFYADFTKQGFSVMLQLFIKEQ